MIARITYAGQTVAHTDVVRAWAEHGYLKLLHEGYPHQTNYWLKRMDVLICATEQDFIDALREEREAKQQQTDMDSVRRG